MRIGIIACDALKDEIEALTRDTQDVVIREYLDFGYHLDPPRMRQILTEKVNSLAGKVDLVFLGYAYCQSLKGLPSELTVPTIMLEYEDCIACLLGPDEYARQKHKGKITWFYPGGWAKYGLEGLTQLFKLDSLRNQGYESIYFLKLMFDGFSRCLFIDTKVGDIALSEANSRHFANKLGMEHDRTEGTLCNLEEVWSRVRSKTIELEMLQEPEILAKNNEHILNDSQSELSGHLI